MTVWIGAGGEIGATIRKGPFDGLLIILNIGKDNYIQLQMSKEYEESLVAAVNMAHAKGFAIVHVFEPLQFSEPALEIEWMEDIDFTRLTSYYGIPGTDFSTDLAARKTQFTQLADAISTDNEMSFSKNCPVMIMGSCSIGGQRVLMPLDEIGALGMHSHGPSKGGPNKIQRLEY